MFIEGALILHRIFVFIFLLFTPFFYAQGISESHFHDDLVATFTPPEGFLMVDRKALPKEKGLPPSVKVMVIGQGRFPPSMNLAIEPFGGTTEDYQKIIKRFNQSPEYRWVDLGSLKSTAGNLRISQLDTSSEWGALRMMHAILVKDGNAYIMTAAALKDEFLKYHKAFFHSFSTFAIKEILKDGSRAKIDEQITFKELQKNTNICHTSEHVFSDYVFK